MTAARVINPGVLSELCKFGASPSSRSLPCSRQLKSIKRDLFGPANPAEISKIFTEEIEKHQEKAIKKWGFDFRNGHPLATNAQFIWERVSFHESHYAPEMYTLTRAAHVRPVPDPPTAHDLLMDERAEREHYATNMSASTDTDSCDDELLSPSSPSASPSSSVVVFKVPALAGHGGRETTLTISCDGKASSLRKRQPRITEYMKERKRLAQTPKKMSSPAKRMRTSSGGNSTGSSSGSNSPQSISVHFAQRSHRRTVSPSSSSLTQRKN